MTTARIRGAPILALACLGLVLSASVSNAGFTALDTSKIRARLSRLESASVRRVSAAARADAGESEAGHSEVVPTIKSGLRGMNRRTQARVKRKARKHKGMLRYDEPEEYAHFLERQRRSPTVGTVPGSRLLELKLQADRMRGGRLGRPGPVLARKLAPGSPEVLASQAQGIQAQSEATAASRGGVNDWTSIGPGNIGGRTRGLVAQTSQILYAGGVAGGVWKTTNGGNSWVFLDDFMANLAVSTLAQDPENTSVLYAGTGEGYFNGDAVRGAGIFKTTDAGASWTQLAATAASDFYYVNKVWVSPNDSSRVYAATRTGVFRSADGGSTWTSRSSGNFIELAVHDRGDSDLVLAWKRSDGIYRSIDSGGTFAASSSGLTSNQTRGSIAISKDGTKIYVAVAGSQGKLGSDSVVGVYRSVDEGASWTLRTDFSATAQGRVNTLLFSNPLFGADIDGDGFGECIGGTAVGLNQGWYDNVIAVDPVNSERIWVGGVDLFRSDDGGANFNVASYWWKDISDPHYNHADQHAIVFDPGYDGDSNQRIFFGNDGGVSKTENGAAAVGSPVSATLCGSGSLPAVTFTSLNNNYGVTQFYHGAASTSGTVYIGGTQDNGTLKFNPASPDKDWDEIFGGDGGYVAVDRFNSNVMFTETTNLSIRKSVDGGANFNTVTSGITESAGNFLFIAPYAMDPSNSDRLWIGGLAPWRTTDGAATWTHGNGGADLTSFSISAIGIAPGDSGNTVYVGSFHGEVYRTNNALDSIPTWTDVLNASLPGFGVWVSWIAVHPTNKDEAYLTYENFDLSSQIFRTTNGGLTWISAQGSGDTAIPNVPIHCVAIHPTSTQRLYAGTDMGVFASTDSGATWTNVSSPGLANTVVEALVFQGSSKLLAFTHGRGVFAADVTESASLKILSIAPVSTTIGVGRSFLTTVILSNTGTATANLSAAGLVFSNGSLSAPQVALSEALVGNGGQTSVTFNVTAGTSAGTSQITSALITATDSGTGEAVPVASNDASSVDITIAPLANVTGVKIESITASRTSANLGQQMQVTVTLSNDGGATANLTKQTLVKSSNNLTSTPLTETTSLAGAGGTAQFTFPVTPSSLGSTTITSIVVEGANAVTGEPVQILANLAFPVTVAVKSLGRLQILNLFPSRTRVSRGQAGTSVGVVAFNPGDAATGGEVINLAGALRFNGNTVGYTVRSMPGNPTALKAGESGLVLYEVDVQQSAAVGATFIAADLTGNDLNAGTAVAANQSPFTSWTVQAPANLQSAFVRVFQSQVLRGQENLKVEISVTNAVSPSAGTRAMGLSGTPLFNGSTAGHVVRPDPANPRELAAGRTAILTYSVDVLFGAPLGSITIGSSITAFEENSGSSLSAASIQETVWNVLSPGQLQVDGLQGPGPRLARGQTGLPVTVDVFNPGDFDVQFSSELRFNGAPLGYSVTSDSQNATTLSTRQSARLTFLVDVLATAPTGSTTVTLIATARIPSTGLLAPVINMALTTWTVLSPAALRGSDLSTPPSFVYRGDREQIQVSITNLGETTAVDLTTGPRFNGDSTGYLISTSPQVPTSLGPGSTTTFQFTVDVTPAAPLGPTTITLFAGARDIHGAGPAPVEGLGSAAWTVLTSPQIELPAITLSRAVVTRGQEGLLAHVQVRNQNDQQFGAGLEQVATVLEIGSAPGSFQSTPFMAMANAVSLSGGESRVQTFVIHVLDSAPLGDQIVTAKVSAVDPIKSTSSEASLSVTSALRVESVPSLEVTSVLVSRVLVSQGQAGLKVEAVVTSSGADGPAARVDELTASLLFNGLSQGYVVTTAPTNLRQLSGGSSVRLTFTVDVLPTAMPGAVAVNSVVSGQDANTGREVVARNSTFGSWTVQTPPALVVSGQLTGRAFYSIGEAGIPVAYQVRNDGGAAARITSATLLFNLSSAGYSVITTGPIPFDLPGGQQRAVGFLIGILEEATPDKVLLAPRLQAHDISSGSTASVRVDASGSWLIQTRPRLEILQIAAARTAFPPGAEGEAVVTVRNRGGATVRLSQVQLVTDSSGVLQITSHPLNIELGASSTDLGVPFRTVSIGSSKIVSVLLSGLDVNSGEPTAIVTNRALPGPEIEVRDVPIARLDAASPRYLIDDRAIQLLFDARQSRSPSGDGLTYSWSQFSGPAISITTGSTASQNILVSTPETYVLQVTVADSVGLSATATALTRVEGNRSPRIDSLANRQALLGERLRLAGVAEDPDGDALTYSWSLQSGSASVSLILSGPQDPSVVVSPVETGAYVLRFAARDSRQGLASTTLTVQIDEPPHVSRRLGLGANILSLPFSPISTDGSRYGARHLVRDTGATAVVKLDLVGLPRTQFIAHIPGFTPSFDLEPGEAYLVMIPNRERQVRLSGRTWNSGSQIQILRPALGFVSYPMGVAPGETAQTLLDRAKANFVVRTRIAADGRSRFEIYLPGLTPAFPIESGAGYLVGVPAKVQVGLPSK